ncbi:MAG: N-methyl-L-tryptophan oxidase [Chloroflexi bacterium]|nr:N-methyl-L-tryptophan oxidase [Chloroflexota bacterium]
MNNNHYDYIVLGLGGLGSAAVSWLARRGAGTVLGLEQFELGHVRGGSQDHSRIIRLSYHTPAYVRLAQQAYAAWDETAALAQEQLVVQTGGLDFFPAGGAIIAGDYVNSLRLNGVPFEWLDAAETMHRWPQFRLPEGVETLYQEQSGLVAAARANAAHQRLAREHGATLLEGQSITALRPTAEGVEVVTAEGSYVGRKLIVTAGAWSNHALAHFGWQLPLTVTQEQVAYFATPHPEQFTPDKFPIWIWMDEPCYYGFPIFGEPATKVAQDVGGAEVTAETRSFTPNPANLARVEAFTQQVIPQAYGPLHLAKTCLYTMPPDRDFVLDALPEYPQVLVAIGAGHAFKFASLIGKILSELAIDGHTASDISPFALTRPILHEENPPKQFMV